MDEPADVTNRNIEISYISALVGLAVILVTIHRLRKHSAFLGNKNATGSVEHSRSTALTAWFKSEIAHAPLWRVRRAKEATIFNGKLSLGQLPARPHFLCIFVFLGLNIFLVTWNLPWTAEATTLIPLLRNRLGSVAVANLIPIVITSTIQNPLIKLLQISYDSFNLIHRWIARITTLEIIAHGLCNILGLGIHQGWDRFRESLKTPYVHYGLTAAITAVIIFIQASKPIRSLAYEVFHYIHMILIVVMFSFIWLHLQGHYQRYYLLVAVITWAVARLSRFANTMYRSWGTSQQSCTALVEEMPADAVKVTLLLARPWKFQPGQSLYINIPRISWWASHPFSVAWADDRPHLNKDIEAGEGSSSSNESSPSRATGQQALYLIIKKRSGMTSSLFRHVEANKGRAEFTALVQGPHGISSPLIKYSSVLLFAAGVGITHQLSFVKRVVDIGSIDNKTARRIRLVWAVPTAEALEWVWPWLQEIMSQGERSSSNINVKILLFITRHEGDESKIPYSHQLLNITLARPNVFTLVEEEAKQRRGKMFVSVCANGSMADDVRLNVRRLLRKQVDVDFHEEGFGW